MSKSSVKIIFFGTSDFAVPALAALVKEGYGVVAVITAPDKPVGRKQILTPPPVKVVAEKLGLEIWQPKNLKIENLDLIENCPDSALQNRGSSTCLANREKLEIGNYDLGVVAAYGKLIPPEVFNLPKHGTLNIHPSLLPKYRGPSPIQTAILNSDTETGITIMKVDEEMDHGDIVATTNRQLPATSTYQDLHDDLAKLGAELLIKTLPDYLANKIKPQSQDHSKATYTRKFTFEEGGIKSDDTAESAYNKIRALNPEPGTYFVTESGFKLKILVAQPPNNLVVEPLRKGLFIKEGSLALGLKNGCLILITVQPEGKKPMSGQDFARGYGKMLK